MRFAEPTARGARRRRGAWREARPRRSAGQPASASGGPLNRAESSGLRPGVGTGRRRGVLRCPTREKRRGRASRRKTQRALKVGGVEQDSAGEDVHAGRGSRVRDATCATGGEGGQDGVLEHAACASGSRAAGGCGAPGRRDQDARGRVDAQLRLASSRRGLSRGGRRARGTERLPSNANSADRDATRSTTLCAEMPVAAVAAAARFWPSAPTVLPRRRRPDAERPLLLLLRARQASVSSSMRHTPAVDELGARGEGRRRVRVTIAFTVKVWRAPAGSGSVRALPREDQRAADE